MASNLQNNILPKLLCADRQELSMKHNGSPTWRWSDVAARKCVRRSLTAKRAVVRPFKVVVGIVFATPMRCFAHGPLFCYCATHPAELFPVQTHYTNFHSCGCEPPALGIGLYYLSFIVDLVLEVNANCRSMCCYQSDVRPWLFYARLNSCCAPSEMLL